MGCLTYANLHVKNFCLRLGERLRSLFLQTSVLPTPNKAKMVGLGRLELPTSPLSGVRSNQLSYRPITLDLF